jgi:hypothetical protein
VQVGTKGLRINEAVIHNTLRTSGFGRMGMNKIEYVTMLFKRGYRGTSSFNQNAEKYCSNSQRWLFLEQHGSIITRQVYCNSAAFFSPSLLRGDSTCSEERPRQIRSPSWRSSLAHRSIRANNEERSCMPPLLLRSLAACAVLAIPFFVLVNFMVAPIGFRIRQHLYSRNT